MRILVIGINYTPEKISVGPFTTGLCEHLVAQGHQVTVFTGFPYYPEWRVWDDYRGSIYRREVINGVTVHRIAHFVPRKPSSLIQRLTYDISFTINSFVAALFAGRCDVVYCSCPPPTVGFSAYLLAKLRGVPYVIKLTDLASDAALATGIMKPGIAIRAARVFESFTYRNALAVVCLCRGFIDRLKERGIAEKKLLLIPDWGDTQNVRPCEDDNTFRLANGLTREQFLIFHTGNMGKKQYLINVLRAAEITRNDASVVWVLVGQGEERQHLEREISARNLTNVRVLPLQPVEGMRQMYSTANLLLLNQVAAMEDAVIPSKLLTYMASGRPIVAAVSEKSEGARQIHLANCGVVVPAETPQALVDAVLALRQNPALSDEFGANGRTYAVEKFTKASVLQAYDDFFQTVDSSVGKLRSAVRRAASPEESEQS